MERGVATLSPRDWRAQTLTRRPLFAGGACPDLDASRAGTYAATIATRMGRAPRIPCKRGSVARHLLPRGRAWPDRREGAAQSLRGILCRNTLD
jgi:hypothetical protein